MSETTCECGKPTSGAILCDDCCKTLAVALANVSAYWADLETVQTKTVRYGSTGATKGSPGKESPLPIDARFATAEAGGTQVKWDVWSTVVTWCRAVMEDQPELTGPVCVTCLHVSCAAIRRRRWPRNTVRSMLAYLDRQFRWIVREPWAPEFLDSMLDCERRLRRLIDRPADRWYAGKCSIADEHGTCTAELYAIAGAETVTCPACAFEHRVAYRREVLLREAEDYLVTATEAAHALASWTEYDGTRDSLRDRIQKWRDRDQLTERGHVEQGGKDRPLYRLGDVVTLLTRASRDEKRERSA